MNLKLLFIISSSEKKVTHFIKMFNLPFNTISRANGTASRSMLDFFGLKESEKYVVVSIFPDYMEKTIYTKLNDYLKLKEIGNGIAFSIPLSSSSEYIRDTFKKKEDGMMEEQLKSNNKYHLLLSVVQEGYAEKVMNAAKKCGANGGTLINGRGAGGRNSLKFFNMTIEPEKDIILIVCEENKKNEIMEAIIEKTGIKTEGKGYCISLPIDNSIGLNIDDN